jgi:hypothetical protein
MQPDAKADRKAYIPPQVKQVTEKQAKQLLRGRQPAVIKQEQGCLNSWNPNRGVTRAGRKPKGPARSLGKSDSANNRGG